ncbi:MAG: hypothetical protein ACP5O3_00640 [Candidatus Micrarchaeia archaeon]
MGCLFSSDFAFKYPFSGAAKSLLAEVGREAVDAASLRRAASRVVALLGGAREWGSGREALVDYALARLVLACWDKPSVTWKFARRLAASTLKSLDDEDLEALGKDFFSSLEVGESGYCVSLADFLSNGGELLYAPLEHGRVFLDRQEFESLLRSAAARRIALLSFSRKEVPSLVFDVAKEFEARIPREEESRSRAGKYLALPCIARILEGMPEGKRFYGAMALSIACVKDGLPREDAEKVLKRYVENCAKGSQPYTWREALSTLEWVYRHASIGFSCKRMMEQGIVSDCGECVLARRGKHSE